MRKVSKIIAAAALAATTATTFSVPAEARTHHRHHYYGRTYYGHRYCRYSSGTTGLVAGGVGGAVVGSKVFGGPVGAIAGAVGGAMAGRAIDRHARSCQCSLATGRDQRQHRLRILNGEINLIRFQLRVDRLTGGTCFEGAEVPEQKLGAVRRDERDRIPRADAEDA